LACSSEIMTSLNDCSASVKLAAAADAPDGAALETAGVEPPVRLEIEESAESTPATAAMIGIILSRL
jgi:hypothetical protein